MAFDVLSLFYGVGEAKLATGASKIISAVRDFGSLFTSYLKLPASLLLKPIRKGTLIVGLGIASVALPVQEAKAFIAVEQTTTTLVARVVGAEAATAADVNLAKSISSQSGFSEALVGFDITGASGGRLSSGLARHVSQDLAGQATLISEQSNGTLRPLVLLYTSGRIVQLAEDVTHCEVCQTRSQLVCDAYQQVRDKAVSAGMAKADAEAGVNKMCAAIADESNLLNMASTLNTAFTAAQVQAFLGDVSQSVADTNALANHVAQLKTDLLNSWQQLYPSSFEEQFNYLWSIRDLTTKYQYSVQVNGNQNVTLSGNGQQWASLIGRQITAVGGTGTGSSTAQRNQLLNLVPLLSNVTYTVDRDFQYETDGIGRVSRITGALGNTPNGRRDPEEQRRAKVVKDGLVTDNTVDDGGHMIGARFNGPVEQINYFPQNTVSNRYGDWKTMEDEWQGVLQGRLRQVNNAPASPPVRVEISPNFLGSSKRPVSFTVTYFYNGVLASQDQLTGDQSRTIPNP